jgi:caffeoyl-CoA O-methyltransferase
MSTTTGIANDALSAYVAAMGCRETPVRAALRERTAQMDQANMQIAPLEGAFLQTLALISGATRYLEVGVFTGYSSLAVAEVLPDDGHIVACDRSEEWTDIAREHWRQAGVEHKIDLRLGYARQTLQTLVDEGQVFDFAFIDADKENYEAYYELALKLVRPGGFIAVDNVLWGGAVVETNPESASTRAIQAFNEARRHDGRVHLSLVPIADGVTLLTLPAEPA